MQEICVNKYFPNIASLNAIRTFTFESIYFYTSSYEKYLEIFNHLCVSYMRTVMLNIAVYIINTLYNIRVLLKIIFTF
jgi:hypothetical protein